MLDKKIIAMILILICIIAYWKAPEKKILGSHNNLVSANGNLYIQGNTIYNKYNKPFVLKGLSSHGLQWYSDVLTYDNLKYLRDEWKINVFRLALYTEDNGYISNHALKDKVIELTNILIKLDMYVIIDWHILTDGDPLKYLDESKVFFNEISLRYSQSPNVLYEICNEPNHVTWEDSIKPYATKIIPIIRANSPDSIIIVGTPSWSTEVDAVINNPLEYTNVAYSCHFYSATHKSETRNKIKKAINNNLCVFVTEWGTTDLTGNKELSLDSAEEWMIFLNEYNISWINWSFSNKNESSAILRPVKINSCLDIDSNLTASGEFVKKYISTK